MKNSDLLVRFLQESGVGWVFGIPSGPVLPLIESLRQSSVPFILTASETSAGFMAATVGYLTGRPGVCVSTLGPGATNLTTGVGSAWLDRCPCLAITCNVPTAWLERRIQMRIDHHTLFKPLTKATLSLAHGRIAETVAEAFNVAVTEPPGPVHLDFPEDVAEALATESVYHPLSTPELPNLSAELALELSAALESARKPLLVTGLTFTRSQQARQLLQFIEKQKIPFVTTLHAKGFLPESHENWVGVIGRARRTDVKAFTDDADLILAVGYDPIEINYEEWAANRPVIHISSEAAEIGSETSFAWNRACDLDRAIEAMARLPEFSNQWNRDDWRKHRRNLERSLRPEVEDFAIHHLLDVLRDKLPSDGILAYDVGAHTHQIASQWRTDHPKTLLATNGWSSMGYGTPAAFAAKLVFPERQVAAVVGDGGFQMTVGELALARRLKLAVPVIVLNDGWLGLMKVKQERKGYGLSGVYLGEPVDSPPHYFGVPCRSAKNLKDLSAALDWALGLNGPSVVEAFIDVGSYSQTVFD
ncbi:MAG TPA: thiamine pyrophosphate-binding protein [Candidatus Binatia bacterium]|nr:thiamine pyrophosphate-binding protein [Candidatus Binatia bacterium]